MQPVADRVIMYNIIYEVERRLQCKERTRARGLKTIYGLHSGRRKITSADRSCVTV